MADTATEIVIASTVLSATTTTFTFNSIPNTYTDLRLVLLARGNYPSTGVQFSILLNSDSATNYSQTYLAGDGTTISSGRNISRSSVEGFMPAASRANGVFALNTYDIFGYAGSTYKTYLFSYAEDENGTGSLIEYESGLWRSTSAISSITISSSGVGNFVAGTMATLYGIL